ncbi:MAG: transcriptional repressor [Candidatus Pacebacteria bacterium]|nr:transcriptional repressor [Candidatus Paceibacterota bacterium]
MKRTTNDRKVIQEVLSKAQQPLTVREIRKSAGQSVHLSTVYRAITEMSSEGSIRRVDFGGRVPRYEVAGEHHHHIVCTTCGDIEDVHTEPRGLEKAALVESKKFKSVHAHSLEFFGVCKKCT